MQVRFGDAFEQQPFFISSSFYVVCQCQRFGALAVLVYLGIAECAPAVFLQQIAVGGHGYVEELVAEQFKLDDGSVGLHPAYETGVGGDGRGAEAVGHHEKQEHESAYHGVLNGESFHV